VTVGASRGRPRRRGGAIAAGCAAIAIAAGCAFTPVDPGQAPEPTGSATPPLDPQTDPDGDGVLGTADNCPALANADQLNEDGDARGDACDPCPGIGDGDGDSDRDGVGDACDPYPSTPGDQLVWFSGFAEARLGPPAGWSVIYGDGSRWKSERGALVYTGVSGGSSAEDLIALAPPGGTSGGRTVLTIDASVTLTHKHATIAVISVASDLDRTPQRLRYVHCGVRLDVNGAELWRYDTADRPGYWSGPFGTSPRSALTTYRMVSRGAPTGAVCTITDASTAVLTSDHAPFGGGRVGLRSLRLSGEIAYVAVYRSPVRDDGDLR
jgi:hypothetical protein